MNQRINITLPHELVRQLQYSIPNGKRSEFIAKAVSEKLGGKRNREKELRKSLKENAEFYKAVAKEWEGIELEQWPE